MAAKTAAKSALIGGGLVSAGWVASNWDSRLFVADNAMGILLHTIRLWPRLAKAKTREDVNQVAGMMNQSIDWLAKRAGFSTETVNAQVEGLEIPVFLARPANPVGDKLPIIVWFHGGGMCIGDAHDAMITSMPPVGFGILDHFAGKAIICSVQYRMAPEHVFPAGVEECIAATKWIQENATKLGGDPERVSVGGMSAGGYLAANVHLAARDRGFPLKSAVMVCPMLRRNTNSKSWQEFADGKTLTRQGMDWFWNTYAPDPAVASDPRCEPVRGVGAGNLAPCLLLTNDYDGLRDEGLEHLEALRAAGVDVEHVRARTSHAGTGADRERWALVLRWWSRSVGLVESRL